MNGFRRAWPGVALLVSSACAMALEIVAGRLLAPYVGMSLYTWTAIIAVVLGGLSLGHWLGGALVDRARPRPACWQGSIPCRRSGSWRSRPSSCRASSPACSPRS